MLHAQHCHAVMPPTSSQFIDSAEAKKKKQNRASLSPQQQQQPGEVVEGKELEPAKLVSFKAGSSADNLIKVRVIS